MSVVSLHQLNKLDGEKFSIILKGVYEHSPWIIEGAFNCRPFNTIEELHDTCATLINGASHDTQLSLIRAHPDLAAKLEQLPKLTKFSQEEQSKAGFSSLPLDVIRQLRKELVHYRKIFGHPFILCLAENTAADVLPESGEASGTGGAIAREVSRFVTGFVGGGYVLKGLGWARGANQGFNITRSFEILKL